jgi:hypothetical protein
VCVCVCVCVMGGGGEGALRKVLCSYRGTCTVRARTVLRHIVVHLREARDS